jgi:hypothetical protein
MCLKGKREQEFPQYQFSLPAFALVKRGVGLAQSSATNEQRAKTPNPTPGGQAPKETNERPDARPHTPKTQPHHPDHPGTLEATLLDVPISVLEDYCIGTQQ